MSRISRESNDRRNAERLRLALAAGQLGDWSWDAASDRVEFGPRGAEIFGLDPNQPVTWQELRDLLDENDRERARIGVETALAQRTDYHIEYRLTRPSGERVWIAAEGRGVYHPDGTVEGMIGVVRDISEQKSAEELRYRLAAIVDSSDDAIISKTLQGIITTWNKGAERVFGYTAEEAIGQPILMLIPPDRHHEEDMILAKLRAGERIQHFETVRIRKDGRHLNISLSISPVKDAQGDIIGAAKIARDISERRLAAELQARLAAVVDSSQDAIVSKTLDGIITTWNKGAERIFGYTAEETIGNSILMLIPPDRHDEEAMILAKIRRGECVEHYDTIRLRKGGQPINVSVTISPIRDATGQIIGASKIGRDITEKKRAEEILRRSEAEMRTLADAIPQLTWMARADGHITWYNRGWYDYTGKSPQEMEGWGWQSVHSPEHLPMVTERWQRSLKTGEPFEMEFPLRGADGQFRWFLTRVNPVHDDAGEIVRWFGTNTNVDEVKRAENALREETSALELINQTGVTLSSTLEIDNLLQAITDAATKLCGAQFGAFFYNVADDQSESYVLYTLSGAPREAFEKFGHPRATPLFGPTFRGEKPIRSDDVLKDPRYGQMAPHHGMPSGHLPVRSYLAVPVVSRSGDVLGGLFFGHSQPARFSERHERIISGVASQAAVAIDNARLYDQVRRAAEERAELLDAERAARADAERMNLMKDEFLATLSHELRTPLNAILGWSQVLNLGEVPNDEFRQGLEAIERNARAQTQLIEDLLDMSRIISGKIRLDVQWTELASVVETAVQSVRPSADAKGIRIRTILDPLAGPVAGDPTRLQQVIWNLLTNAIKFTPKGGKVDVMLERVNSHLEITVHDSGIGIKPEFLPQIFDRFRQVDSSTTRSYGGLGLGLSIVKNLVELHGGTVRAKSPGEGQGSTFIVSLPLAPFRSGEVREHPATPKPGAIDCEAVSLKGITVLVVDDEPDAGSLIHRVLSQCEAEVTVASNATEGLSLLKEHKPDVLISDIGMPEIDGYQFLRQVRQLSPEEGGKIPAIALTAFARSEDRTRAMMAGYHVHIAKPIEAQELLATVASLAGRTGG